jgi:hypothetical protein
MAEALDDRAALVAAVVPDLVAEQASRDAQPDSRAGGRSRRRTGCSFDRDASISL